MLLTTMSVFIDSSLNSAMYEASIITDLIYRHRGHLNFHFGPLNFHIV